MTKMMIMMKQCKTFFRECPRVNRNLVIKTCFHQSVWVSECGKYT